MTRREVPQPKRDPETGCDIWQGFTDKNGYGKMWAPDISTAGPSWAHRVFWVRGRGAIPKRMQIHHTCGNRACVRVEHMELLSPRGHGQKTGRAKLIFEQVVEIRKRLRAGERNRDLAREFGVHENTICDIKAGRKWQQAITCPECGHKFDPYEPK